MIHKAVLQKEVIEYLDPKPNENFVDATIGEAGHTAAILERNKPNGKVLGIEIDPEMIKSLEFRIKNLEFRNRLILVNDSYTNLKKIVEKYNFEWNGILFDLGMSSWHLEQSERGFSFMKDEPLDMRYYMNNALTAEFIVNKWPEKEIAKILKEYGGERFAKRIAGKIVDSRKVKLVKTTSQLKEIIVRAIPKKFRHQRIHCATRTFQALRIAVNDELNNLKRALPQAVEILEPNGRLVIISFHYGEDRIVKNFFREESKKGILQILTKKPIRPLPEEININPRSRSALLRAAIKIIKHKT